ncbi:DUF3099 domain-containing protein [Microbacterium sp. KR10-403]|uniref:DUF3099 domain-containing protein n=1 Tax=Microbacterium sp. KR10-403 TaxID=3158581 RepID=UPI0032E47C80
MKNSAHTQSTTSLPRAPHDEVHSRSTRYLIMMGVRVLCFILMVFVQPFGWWTWIFGAGAIFLPYIAVVLANVGEDGKTINAVPPGRELEAHPTPPPSSDAHDEVITVRETREIPHPDHAPKDPS